MSGQSAGMSVTRNNGLVMLRGLDSAGARAVAAAMIGAGARVEVEPYPDDEWVASFKDESGLFEVAMSVVGSPDEGESNVLRSFRVSVVRTGTGERLVVVEARSAAEAEEIALRDAGEHEYREHSSDYHASATPA